VAFQASDVLYRHVSFRPEMVNTNVTINVSMAADNSSSWNVIRSTLSGSVRRKW
jgi:hypothetical protein